MQISRIKIILSLFVIVICFVFLTLQKRDAKSFRFPVNNSFRQLAQHEIPGNIQSNLNGEQIFSLRDNINLKAIPQQFVDAMLLLVETPNLIHNSAITEIAAKNGTLFANEKDAFSIIPILNLDGGYAPNIYANFLHRNSEAFDINGKPLRWHNAEQLLAGISPPRPWIILEKEPPPSIQSKLSTKAATAYYHDLVVNFAGRFGLNTALVLAIIHSESNFRPSLISNKSAMGLMQLLPSTASDEVHRFLYGRQGNIGYKDLSNPEVNIRYGTAYLHILQTRYFAHIKNREIRETCVIAAYNLGPNRFIKLYGASPETAAEEINKMSLEEFLNDLQSRLPARETRNFVEKVRRMKNFYTSMQ